MRPVRGVLVLAFLLPLLCVSGCKSNNRGKIEGTYWRSQGKTVGGAYLPPGSLSLEFHKDGTFTYRIRPVQGAPITVTGTYTLTFGDYITMHCDEEIRGSKVHTEQVEIKGNLLTMTDTDGTSLRFDKVN